MPTDPAKHFHGLTPAEAERLYFVAEECGEVIQAAHRPPRREGGMRR